MGITGLIFNKAPRMTAKQVKYDVIELTEAGKKIKKKVLPPEYSHLQDRLEVFLSETGLKISANNLLIDGPNEIQPQVEIKVKKGKEKGKCFICGGMFSFINRNWGYCIPYDYWIFRCIII